jgi:spore coat protein U-like protein
MSMIMIRKLFLGFILLFISSEIMAGTCHISGSNISFGRYVRTNPSLDALGTFFVTCDDSATYTYCVIINTALPSPNRRLTRTSGGLQFLNYELYSNTWGGTIWQNNACTYVTQSCPYTAPCQHLIYGRIPTGQNRGNGSYQGTITVHLDINTTPVVTYAQAYINNGCSVAADLFNYGTYDPTASSDLLIQATNIHVTCNTGAPYNMGLSASSGGCTTGGTRCMKNGANQLNYNFYTTAGRTLIWGDTIGVNTVTGTGTNTQQNYTVYGTIPKNQSVPVGSYLDTITVTVTY